LRSTMKELKETILKQRGLELSQAYEETEYF
jgi:hypothetical protein